eukprot:CAMPEP_0184739904 /NCGR_PEP_ID=MMETSP0315-20130426/2834_1 /TAXON_ID=101924 /ORGANISM="Rhodosorus marinus, Strain UTEX LB 2760" /LENGTH=1102 /DNA_ID=CAMNT_0027209133 /DNA_START=381 /DNA_END=3691 /DNA_ORIENTATION=+
MDVLGKAADEIIAQVDLEVGPEIGGVDDKEVNEMTGQKGKRRFSGTLFINFLRGLQGPSCLFCIGITTSIPKKQPIDDDEAHGPQPPPSNSKPRPKEQAPEVVKQPAEVNRNLQESEHNQKQDAIAHKPAVPPAESKAMSTAKVDKRTETDMSSKPPDYRPATTKVKQKRAKPIRGFFGGDEDDDDAGVEEQLQRNKKKFIGLSDEEDEEVKMLNDASKTTETAAAVSPRAANGAEADEIALDSTEQAGADEDTLDAFMNNIEEQVQVTNSKEEAEGTGRLLSDDDDAGGIRKAASDEEEDFVVEEEEEEESWLTKLRKKRPTYEKINHSEMNYEDVKKAFYIESAELTRMTDEQVARYRRELGGIKIRGKRCPRPVKTWGQCGLPSKVLEAIIKLKYEKPTPIQAQAIPCIMSGRDVIGVAKTGSGKTLSFLLPMMRHVAAQPRVAPGEGPVGLIIAPTRELAMQIYGEARRFCKAMGFKCVCAYGGSGVGEQISDLKRGADIVVCTPGRMIDLLTMNQGRITNLARVTFVVLDEADRMFDMGFEPQITRVVENVRPKRQTVMFSATFPSQVEFLARRILKAPVEITVGGNSVASATIEQHVEVIDEDKKLSRLLDIISDWQGKGSILVFVERQESADRIFRDLARTGQRCLSLHGGMDQDDRDSAIVDFKNQVVDLLVATSVAARGLDVKHLRVVVNYDVPNHYEDYVHRVGRTGRAGNQGTAYTFITKEQDIHAGELVKALELSAKKAVEDANPDKKTEELKLEDVAKAAVPEELQKLADGFSEKRKAGIVKHGAGSGYGGKGFKFTEDEENANVAIKKLQAEEYGVAVKSTEKNDDEEDEPIIKDVKRDSSGQNRADDHATSKNESLSTNASAILTNPDGSKKVLSESLGSNNGELVRAQIELKKQQVEKEGVVDPKRKGDIVARQIASVLSNLAVKPPPRPQPSAPQQPVKQAPAASSPASAEQSAAAKAAAEINLRLGHAAAAPVEQPEPEENEEPLRKYTELEINDYPQHARWKVTHKNSLADIEEFTNCATTTKGLFYPPGRNPAAGERKLYLLIEGPDESSVKTARSEIKRRLDEAALSRPEEKPQYGKYSIV